MRLKKNHAGHCHLNTSRKKIKNFPLGTQLSMHHLHFKCSAQTDDICRRVRKQLLRVTVRNTLIIPEDIGSPKEERTDPYLLLSIS